MATRPENTDVVAVTGGTIISLCEDLPEFEGEFQGYKQKGVNLNEKTGEETPRYVFDFELYDDLTFDGKTTPAGDIVSFWGSYHFKKLQAVADLGLAPCYVRMEWKGKKPIKKGAQQLNDIVIGVPADIASALGAAEDGKLAL